MFLPPFVFITLTALMTNDQALSSKLWPHPFVWHNFVAVFEERRSGGTHSTASSTPASRP